MALMLRETANHEEMAENALVPFGQTGAGSQAATGTLLPSKNMAGTMSSQIAAAT